MKTVLVPIGLDDDWLRGGHDAVGEPRRKTSGRPVVEGRWVTLPGVGPICLPGEPPEGQEGCDEERSPARLKDLPKVDEADLENAGQDAWKVLRDSYGEQSRDSIQRWYRDWTRGAKIPEGWDEAQYIAQDWIDRRSRGETEHHFLDDLYDYTQKALKDYPEVIPLYRVVRTSDRSWEKAIKGKKPNDTVLVPLKKGYRGGVSFTASAEVAEKMARPWYVGDPPALVMRVNVPKKAVLAAQRVAPAAWNEHAYEDEFIVLAPTEYIRLRVKDIVRMRKHRRKGGK